MKQSSIISKNTLFTQKKENQKFANQKKKLRWPKNQVKWKKINEVSRITKDLHSEFSKDNDGQVPDDEISRRKDDLPSNLSKLDQLSTKLQRCLEIISDEYDEKDTIISQMIENYENLVTEKETYEKFIKSEMKEREMSK